MTQMTLLSITLSNFTSGLYYKIVFKKFGPQSKILHWGPKDLRYTFGPKQP